MVYLGSFCISDGILGHQSAAGDLETKMVKVTAGPCGAADFRGKSCYPLSPAAPLSGIKMLASCAGYTRIIVPLDSAAGLPPSRGRGLSIAAKPPPPPSGPFEPYEPSHRRRVQGDSPVNVHPFPLRGNFPQGETGSKAVRAFRLRGCEKNFLAPQYDIIQKTGLP